jgi:hypothetical protein
MARPKRKKKMGTTGRTASGLAEAERVQRHLKEHGNTPMGPPLYHRPDPELEGQEAFVFGDDAA